MSPIKSPFRSPLYKASPPHKRAKSSARVLFDQNPTESVDNCFDFKSIQSIETSENNVTKADVHCVKLNVQDQFNSLKVSID